MERTYPLDFGIYKIWILDKAILDFKDVSNIKISKTGITISWEWESEIQEIFMEFMNYVTSFFSVFNSWISLNFEEIESYDSDKIAYFRFKKFDEDMYLITNDIWNYYFLSSDSFSLFIQWKVEYIEWYSDLLERGFIKKPSFEKSMIEKYRKKTSFIGIWPALHMIVVTLKETAKKVVDTIMYTNATDITIEFQGGEALLNWEVVKYIVDYATEQWSYLKKNISFTLVTNLTLMTEDKLEWLLNNMVTICTSLDGDELIHNSNRTGYNGNSFEKVTYWIKRVNEELEKRGLGKIWALLTTTKETLSRPKEIVDAYLDLGLDGIFLRWLNPYGFAAADMKNLWYTPEEWLEFYFETLNYIISLNKQGIDFREYITSVYLMKIFMDFDPAFMDVRSPSGIAVWGVAYNYDGKVYASDESRMLWRMWNDEFLMTELLETGQETYLTMI